MCEEVVVRGSCSVGVSWYGRVAVCVNCCLSQLQRTGIAACGSCDVWALWCRGLNVGELWCGSVVVRGNCCVCELRCVAAAVYRSYSLWELQCVSRRVGKLRCGGVLVCGSHGVGELHCGGVAVCGGRGGYQTLIHCVLGVSLVSHKTKNSLGLNRASAQFAIAHWKDIYPENFLMSKSTPATQFRSSTNFFTAPQSKIGNP